MKRLIFICNKLFFLSILIIGLSGVSLFLNHPNFALLFLKIAYWVAVLGTLFYLIGIYCQHEK